MVPAASDGMASTQGQHAGKIRFSGGMTHLQSDALAAAVLHKLCALRSVLHAYSM
jgi:hypothetical protein